MADLNYLTISRAHQLLVDKEISATELTNFYIAKIRQYDPKLQAVLTLCESQALDQAKKVDAKISQGLPLGPLEGIPYSAKDMFMTKGIRTTAGSKILQDYIPPYSSTAIEKLNKAGAILLAKVNQDEFAHGGSTENSAYHVTHNPWNKEYVPGGSSGGSAAAVAADFGIFSLGTDTGGSIRQPASYCGVTGFKPTYGLVSRYGVVAMASSFDCIGPITRTASDAQAVLGVIAGLDSRDSTTIESSISSELEPLAKGIKATFFDAGSASGAVMTMVGSLESNNSDIKFSKSIKADQLFTSQLALAIYYILVPSEISSNLERYDGVRYGSRSAQAGNLEESYSKTRGEFFGPEVKRRNIIGTYALSAGYYDAYYKKAMQARSLIIKSLDEIFLDADVLVGPTTLEPAFRLGSKSDPVAMYKTDLLTVFANLAGLPAVSIPCGIDADTGLPLGLQIIGQQGQDSKVLAVADALQMATNWHTLVGELKL